MKLEQKIAIIYTLVGIAAGFISNFFSKFGYISLVLYLISLPILVRFGERKKKFLWLFYNSFATFILIWLLVWIILFNL